MIKHIHIFGTSFSCGGGFEWEGKDYSEKLKKHYTEQPFTQHYYSWPGQLEKLLGNDVKIHNHAKSGYGNERLYRKAHKIIEANKDKLDTMLFLFEFSGLGRKELWSNEHKQYLTYNYDCNIELPKPIIMGIAKSYEQQIINLEQKDYPNQREVIQSFLEETWNPMEEVDKLNRNMDMFISYLFENKINFKILETFGWKYNGDRNINDYKIQFDKDGRTLWNWIARNKLTITNETNGDIKDEHPSFKGSKVIAKVVAKELNFVKNDIL